MEQLKSKFCSYGGSRGRVTIKNATREECDAVNGIICPKVGFEPPLLSFTVKAFEEGLGQFGDVSLKGVIESYYGISIQTNAEQISKKANKKKSFEDGILSYYIGKPCRKWLEAMFASHRYGYNAVLAQYKDEPKAAETLIRHVCNAVDSRYEQEFEPIGLPVLAAEITGNPHCFDIKESAGCLLIKALGFLSEKTGNNSEEIKEIYFYFGIEPDSITSACATLGIRLYTADGSEHKAIKAFADNNEIVMLSTINLLHIGSADCDRKTVFAVENPAVFMALVPFVIQKGFAMICTSGQLRMCVLKILDMLAESGCTIYYAGDLDPEGLQIADRLLSRYSDSAHTWRMSTADYLSIDKTEIISDSRLKMLDKLRDKGLKELGSAIIKERKAGYQELLIRKMIGDIDKF